MTRKSGAVLVAGAGLLLIALLLWHPQLRRPAVAQGTTVEVASANAAPGQVVTLNVTVKDIPVGDGLGSYDLKVDFNPAVAQVLDVLPGDVPFDAAPFKSIDNNTGVVSFLGVHAVVPGPTGNVVVARLKLQATGIVGQNTALTLTITSLIDTALNTIVAAPTNGALNIVDVVVAAIESGSAVAGAAVLLNVTIKNVTDLDGPQGPSEGLGMYNVRINFTPGAVLVTAEGVQGGNPPFDSFDGVNVDNAQGFVAITKLVAVGPWPTGDVLVARIPFEAVAGATALDMVVNQITDNEATDYLVTDEDGAFQTLTRATVAVPASTNVGPGGSAIVPVTVSQLGDYPNGLGAYNVTIAFDKTVATVAQVLGGDAPFDAAPTAVINNNAGTVQISASQSDPGITADTVVAQVKFTAGATGSTNLNLTVNSLKDTTNADIPFTDGDGALDIVAAVEIETIAPVLAESQVTLDVTVRHVTDLDGLGVYEVHLSYPAGTLTVTDVQGGDAPFDQVPFFNVGNGFVHIAGLQTAIPGPMGDVVVARVVATAPNGDGSIVLDMQVIKLLDTEGNDIPAVDKDGTLTTFTNQPPAAVNDAYTTAEDTVLNVAAAGVLANDTDPENDALTALKVTDPLHGTVVVSANGSFTYTPAANYNGADSFTYKANDTKSDSNVATVNITITAVNDAPTAVGDAYTTNELQPLTVGAPGVLGNDTDPEGNALTASLVTPPVHGFLTLNANGSFTYTPLVFFSGIDTFTYRASDGSLTSNIATVAITVIALPTPVPTATPVVTVIPITEITPVPTPTTPPGQTPVPSASGVVQPNQSTTITETGGNQVSAQFPAGTFSTTTQATVQDVPVSNIPSLPPEIAQVTKAFEILIYDANGTLIEHPALNKCITITAPYTDADVAAAGGSPSNLRLMRYDSLTGAWIVLTTQVDYVHQQLRAQVCGTLSVFAMGVAPLVVAATPTATTAPTPTIPPFKPRVGDAAPGSGLLMGLLVAGAILVLSGAYYLRRAKG